MSLDIAILDDQDRVIRSVGLGVDEHWELLQLSIGASLQLLGRLRDYYSDTEISVEELPLLAEELRVLARRRDLAPTMQRLLTELTNVVQFAISERRSLAVLAD